MTKGLRQRMVGGLFTTVQEDELYRIIKVFVLAATLYLKTIKSDP
jgi:hypothetical protein